MKTHRIAWGLAAAALTMGISTFAQDDCAPFVEAKAEKLYEKAQNKDKYDGPERLAMLEEAIEIDPKCWACHREAAELGFSQFKRTGRGGSEAVAHAREVLENCPDFAPELHYIVGAVAYADRDWPEAENAFEFFLDAVSGGDLPRSISRQIEDAQAALPTIRFEAAFAAHATDFTPEQVRGISTPDDEFLPALSPDGSLLFFTRRSMHKAKGDVITREIEVFEMAHRLDGPTTYEASTPLPAPFNSGPQYGGASVSVDNRELWIAASAPTPTNETNVDLFVTTYEVTGTDANGRPRYAWGELRPVDALNSASGWDAQPALSSDGNTLYFARIDAGTTPDASGNPTMDLMESQRQADGSWSAPVALPAPVNSAAHDKAPFLHPDGKTLFFASDRKPGGGGYDIWVTERDGDTWTEPRNLGAPVNTSGDEHGLVVDIDGQTAYFASRRSGTRGLDVLAFPLPEEFKPEDVMLVRGNLLTSEGLPARNAKVVLQNLNAPDQAKTLQVRPDDGSYAAVIARPEEDEPWVLMAEGEDIAFDAIAIDPVQVVVEAPLEARQLKPGKPLEMKNIQFPVDGSDLDEGSRMILKAFAMHLTRNPQFTVRLDGHTDNTGDPNLNLKLSQERAQSVLDFLVSCGVSSQRLTARGWGPQKPIADNETEAGRRANRRTEFTIFVP
jgi:outer membrane protein OmpA-like peptidoglycan-associated protein